MKKNILEANRILSEYGKRLYQFRSDYFNAEEKHDAIASFTTARIAPSRHLGKRAFILCAVLIIVMSLTVVICSALGIQIFNFRFDYKDGHIILTNRSELPGDNFYKPEYTANRYHFTESVNLGKSGIYYIYETENKKQSYIIEENLSAQDVHYVDNEGYEESSEIYGEYELRIFKDLFSPTVIVYLEKNGTYISINGDLTLKEMHNIIDSLVVDSDRSPNSNVP